jgi:hypothetical protein
MTVYNLSMCLQCSAYHCNSLVLQTERFTHVSSSADVCHSTVVSVMLMVAVDEVVNIRPLVI